MSTTQNVNATANDLASKAQQLPAQAVEGATYAGTRAQQELHGAQGQAHHHTGQTREALDNLERDLEKTTETAVAEGEHDVQQATDTYMSKALSMADYGLSTAQTYLQAGKEKLNAPTTTGEHPTGFTASLASTATAALDAAHRGIGYAHDTLHTQAGHNFPHSHPNEPAHPVTIPTKPMGEALTDNYTAAQAAVQPHVDAAKATVQPHIDAAAATAQPHIDAARQATQPHIDAAMATAQPHIDSARSAAQPYVNQASATASSATDAMKANVNAAVVGAQGQVEAAKQMMNTGSGQMPVMGEQVHQAMDVAKPQTGVGMTAPPQTQANTVPPMGDVARPKDVGKAL